jgi:hypothetical protein
MSPRPSRGGARTSRFTAPPIRKIQTISEWVRTVTRALAVKISASSQSAPTATRTSFQALRARMAMTAAPMP